MLIAEAQREAEILRGEGDAEAIRIFAEAFGAGPEVLRLLPLAAGLSDGARRRCRPASCCRRTASSSASSTASMSSPPAAPASRAGCRGAGPRRVARRQPARRGSGPRCADPPARGGDRMARSAAPRLALVLVVEGVPLGAVPRGMKRAAARAVCRCRAALRLGGLAFAVRRRAAGLADPWLRSMAAWLIGTCLAGAARR